MNNILSLFDGMSCGRLALTSAGIPFSNYYASEIDKWAIQISQKNHPDTIQLGDIENWKQWDIDWSSIDLILAGSPCQGFSTSGRRLNFDDPRSKLFFVFEDILKFVKLANPKVKFLLENVKMKTEWEDEITIRMGVLPMHINSALVSAQNRQRVYWFNWDADQPEDQNILLKDIIENGTVDRDKSFCIDANYWKGGNLKQYFEKSRRQLVFTAENDEKLSYRKLTPLECERLQTVPEGYTQGVSNTQRYKMLGNGWTVDVITHLLNSIK